MFSIRCHHGCILLDADYQYKLRARFLGDAIPAESFAMGANPVGSGRVSANVPLLDYAANIDRWPRDVEEDGGKLPWHHSDMKNLAYFYVWRIYNKIVHD